MKLLDYHKDLSGRDKELFEFKTKAKFIQFCKESGIKNPPDTFAEYLERELRMTVFVKSDGSVYYFIPKRLF
jgi:hypothetical protein